MLRRILLAGPMLFGLMLAAFSAQASMLERLSFDDLSSRADKIFRGRVIDVEQGTKAIGGGEIPIVTYRIRVAEMLKGSADLEKDGRQVMEITMAGSIKNESANDGLMHFSIFRDVPKFERGREYVLFMTPRSSAGLSTPVGLGQGAFDILTTAKEDMAVNQFNNIGLGVSEGEPMSYESMREAVEESAGE